MSDISADRSGPRANFGILFLAFLIDVVLLAIVSIILGLVLKSAGQVLGTLLGIAYYTYLEGSPAGQTVGKRVMGIRVVDFQTGGPLGMGKALIRWVGRIVSSIPCLLGYLWALWDGQNQTWHDKIAGTVVVPVKDYPVSSWP